MNTADTMANARDMPTPTSEAKRARSGLPSPSAWPTRVIMPMPKESGTMNTSEAKLSAIWCADTVTTPKRAISRLTAPNTETSAKYVTPIGTPSLTMLQISGQCGHSQRENGYVWRYTGAMRTHRIIAIRSSHMTMALEMAQPMPPSLGMPNWPKISTQFIATFTARPIRAITITGLVWLMLAL